MWRDDAYLLDILIAAKRAKEFATDLTWEEFQKSDLHQNAIMRTLEIIGEATRRVSEEFKNAHPEMPWKEMVGMRNRLVHEYFSINVERTRFKTISQSLLH